LYLKLKIRNNIEEIDKNKSGKNDPVIKNIGKEINENIMKLSKYFKVFIF
tara:strand:- start:367 stop:516 length:150 start_codon:yes stop_codon:yes gene_type:complete